MYKRYDLKWNGGNPDFFSTEDGRWMKAEEVAPRLKQLEDACSLTQHEICQDLGKVLGYPWYKDHKDIFPDATEADGVCVGDHVAESLAAEAAARIRTLEAALTLMTGIATHQATPWVHPLTCGKDSRHRHLVPKWNGTAVILACLDCDYEQSFLPGLGTPPPAPFGKPQR